MVSHNVCTDWMYRYCVLYLAWWWLNEPKHVTEFLILLTDICYVYWLNKSLYYFLLSTLFLRMNTLYCLSQERSNKLLNFCNQILYKTVLSYVRWAMDVARNVSTIKGFGGKTLTLNIPSLGRQRCLPSWGPWRTPWFFCNFSTVWYGGLLKLCLFGFLKL